LPAKHEKVDGSVEFVGKGPDTVAEKEVSCSTLRVYDANLRQINYQENEEARIVEQNKKKKDMKIRATAC
jgi:hypothetical protein